MFLELDNLSVGYGKRKVLDGMTARMEGTSVGLLGPNGAGKSTLLKAILGFLPPTTGTVRVMGMDVRTEAMAIRQIVGYMPEHESYIMGLSAVRLLRYVGELAGLPRRAAMERAHEVLYYVGVGELRYRPVETYSLGNQQRVKLAQALVHGPRILILDEPTNALEPEGREEMLRLVRDIAAISGAHIIMCSHLMQDIEFCCDAVTVIHRGRVVLNGNLSELKQTHADTYDLRIDGNQEGFIGQLATLGWKCDEADGGMLRVQLPAGEKPRALFEVAASLGVQLRHFHHKRDSLEEIFLSALRDGERNHAHARA